MREVRPAKDCHSTHHCVSYRLERKRAAPADESVLTLLLYLLRALGTQDPLQKLALTYCGYRAHYSRQLPRKSIPTGQTPGHSIAASRRCEQKVANQHRSFKLQHSNHKTLGKGELGKEFREGDIVEIRFFQANLGEGGHLKLCKLAYPIV